MKLYPKTWKYIFEIRYPASAYLFDKRGVIIEQFKSEPFRHWRIERNRVDLHNKENSISVFAGFNNAGATVEDPPSFSYYRDHVQRWLRLIVPEIRLNKITRIGFRVITLVEINNMNFKELFDSFVNSYLNVKDGLWGLKAVEPVDIGVILDSVVGGNRVHMVTGPMEQKQAKEYFECSEVKDKIPALSIFVDLDYYAENPKFGESKLVVDIMKFVNEAGKEVELNINEFLTGFLN